MQSSKRRRGWFSPAAFSCLFRVWIHKFYMVLQIKLLNYLQLLELLETTAKKKSSVFNLPGPAHELHSHILWLVRNLSALSAVELENK